MKKFRSSNEIKVAVIGYGGAFNMGYAHLSEMRGAGMVPTAVCDRDEQRLETAEKDFPGIHTYDRIDDLLKDPEVDLVTVITPHNLHTDHVLPCLQAGKHVVVEKPMAITTAECDEMIQSAKTQKLLLSTYHNRHWDGWILNALKHIQSGEIGKVVRIEIHFGSRGAPQAWWRSSRSISGGLFYDWGVHLLEYALQIADSEMLEVSGFLSEGYWCGQNSPWKEDTIEDDGTIVVRFANGICLTFHITQLDPTPGRKWFEIIGTEGTLAFDERVCCITTQQDGETLIRQFGHPQSEGHLFYKNIADHLIGKAELVITPEWARRPIHIIDLACQSARQQSAQSVVYP